MESAPRPKTTFERGTKSTHGGSLGEGVGGGGVGCLGLLLGVALVELHELGEIKLGLLEDLDLLDEDVLEREDLGALLCDLLGDGVREANSDILIINLKEKSTETATNTYKFLKRSLRVDFWHSLTMISAIF